MEEDHFKESSLIEKEMKIVCEKMTSFGIESIFIGINTKSKDTVCLGTEYGIEFLQQHVNITEDFYKFCHDKYNGSKETHVFDTKQENQRHCMDEKLVDISVKKKCTNDDSDGILKKSSPKQSSKTDSSYEKHFNIATRKIEDRNNIAMSLLSEKATEVTLDESKALCKLCGKVMFKRNIRRHMKSKHNTLHEDTGEQQSKLLLNKETDDGNVMETEEEMDRGDNSVFSSPEKINTVVDTGKVIVGKELAEEKGIQEVRNTRKLSTEKLQPISETKSHNSLERFSCDICGKNFRSFHILEKHLQHQHEGVGQSEKMDRAKSENPIVEVKVHISPATNEASTVTSSDDILNLSPHHFSKHQVECEVCELKLANESSLRRHMRRRHTNMEENLNIENEKQGHDLVASVECKPTQRKSSVKVMSSDRNTFVCYVCWLEYASVKDLGNHMTDKHSIEIEEISEKNDEEHIVPLNGSQNSVGYNGVLDIDNQVPVKKSDGKVFNLSMQHFSKHLNECEFCGLKLASMSGLRRHIKRKHPEMTSKNQKIGHESKSKNVEIHCQNLDETLNITNRSFMTVADSSGLNSALSSLQGDPLFIHGGGNAKNCEKLDHNAEIDGTVSQESVEMVDCLMNPEELASAKGLNVNRIMNTVTIIKNENGEQTTLYNNKYTNCNHVDGNHGVVNHGIGNHGEGNHGDITQNSVEEVEILNQARKYEGKVKCHVCNRMIKERYLRKHVQCHDVNFKWNYNCKECHKGFHSKINLLGHLRAVHRKLDLFKCPKCLQTFHTLISLKKHSTICKGTVIETEHHLAQKRPFTCRECLKKFRSGDALKFHMLKHRLGDWTCKECGLVCRSANILSKHSRTHQGLKTFKCSICCSLYKHAGVYSLHLKNFHKVENCFVCKFCGETFADKLKLNSHAKTVHYTKSSESSANDGSKLNHEILIKSTNACQVCHKLFDNRSELREHAKTHQSDFICEECGKTCSTLSGFKLHKIRHHVDEKPFKCNVCNKQCTSKSNLKSHMKVHQSNYLYQCDECGKCFRRDDCLKNHLKVHEDGYSHKCAHCLRMFRSNDGLKSHILRVHPDTVNFSDYKLKYFQCEYCAMILANKQQYTIHIRTVHTGLKPYTCDTCGASFAMSNRLNRHKKESHLNMIKPIPCAICKGTFKGKSKYRRHLNSNKHKENLEKEGMTAEEFEDMYPVHKRHKYREEKVEIDYWVPDSEILDGNMLQNGTECIIVQVPEGVETYDLPVHTTSGNEIIISSVENVNAINSLLIEQQ